MGIRSRLPAPQAQAFVVCREIWQNSRTKEYMLTGPVSHIPIPRFPADIRVSVYAHVTGGHGSYNLEFQLRAADGATVWRWRPAEPLDHPDPLVPCQLVFHELLLSVSTAGRYDLALQAEGDEIAHQPLLIGPSEVFE